MALPLRLSFPAAPTLPTFEVVAYSLEDGLARLFELTLEVLAPDAALALETVVGQRITVDLDDQPFLSRVSGIVVDAAQLTAEPTGLSRYRLQVAPRLALAKRLRGYQIFQNEDAAGLADTVFRYLGEPTPRRVLLGAALPVHEYVTLFEETHHDFLFRVLAEDGLTLLLDHAADGVVLVDDTSLAPFPPLALLWKPSNLLATGPAILAFERRAALTFARTRVNDYDPEHPDNDLSAKYVAAPLFAEDQTTGWDEWAEGRYASAAAGRERARHINEEHRAERERARATTTHIVPPGVQLTLMGHPAGETPWLVVGTSSEVREVGALQIEARHNVILHPASEPFRPPRRPKPRVRGTQTAVVFSRSGQQVDVDARGRVEVGMRWDPRSAAGGGQTSRRVRVARPWGGALRGFVAFPRAGDEVVLDFLDGDPDRPIVVGCVHHAAQPIPQQIGGEEGVTTWRSASLAGEGGYNEVLMDDAAGGERLELRAERDYCLTVGRDSATRIAANQTIVTVGTQTTKAEHVRIEGTADLLLSTEILSTYAKTAIHNADTQMLFTAPKILLSTGGEGAASILLEGGRIVLTAPAGIEITATGGDVTIRGTPKIKLNP